MRGKISSGNLVKLKPAPFSPPQAENFQGYFKGKLNKNQEIPGTRVVQQCNFQLSIRRCQRLLSETQLCNMMLDPLGVKFQFALVPAPIIPFRMRSVNMKSNPGGGRIFDYQKAVLTRFAFDARWLLCQYSIRLLRGRITKFSFSAVQIVVTIVVSVHLFPRLQSYVAPSALVTSDTASVHLYIGLAFFFEQTLHLSNSEV